MITWWNYLKCLTKARIFRNILWLNSKRSKDGTSVFPGGQWIPGLDLICCISYAWNRREANLKEWVQGLNFKPKAYWIWGNQRTSWFINHWKSHHHSRWLPLKSAWRLLFNFLTAEFTQTSHKLKSIIIETY